MTTYTIALIDDMLAATAPDGNEKLLQERLNDTLNELNAEDRADSEARVEYITGLTLYADEYAAEEDGAEVIYSGSDMGWLEDENGRMDYLAAGRK